MEPIELVTSTAHVPAMRQSIWKSIPTAGQLADPNDVFALIWRTHKAMSGLGLSEATVRHYTDDGLSTILNRHYDIGTDRFSEEILDQIVRAKRFQYEKGQISRVPYQNLRKSAHWVREMYLTGSITQGRIPNWGLREPVAAFKTLLLDFCVEAKTSMVATTLNVARSTIRRFLFEMEDRGFRSLANFTQINVNGCVTSFAAHYAGGLGSAIFSVRLFLKFLFENNLTIIDLSHTLPELVAARKMFREGFTGDELKHLLEHPDRMTAIGKQDYAMMVLAAQSGLRACDVVRLELGSIDWRAMKLYLSIDEQGLKQCALPLLSQGRAGG